MTLTTPALLFPAISLLLLAYTSRFLALANLTRSLHADWKTSGSSVAKRQIVTLSTRLRVIRTMQILGVSSFGLCTVSMFLLFLDQEDAGRAVFGVSLLTLLASLFFSLREIALSNQALNILLQSMAEDAE